MGKFRIFEAQHNGLSFKIEEDLPEVGAYWYVFDGEKGIKDFLQDSIEICKKEAFEEYSVPLDSWIEINIG